MSKKGNGIVYEYGINDMPYGWASKNELNKRIYNCWKNMLLRCYSKHKYKTYKNCYMCNKWIKLSGFVEDVCKIENYELWLKSKDYELDKDTKTNGVNKCYCLENCIFILKSDNISQSVKTRNNDYQQNKERRDKISKTRMEKEIGGGKNNPNHTPIVQLNNDKIINIFLNGQCDASNKMNISQSNISNCCRGKRKTAGGFIWKYLNDISDYEIIKFIFEKYINNEIKH